MNQMDLNVDTFGSIEIFLLLYENSLESQLGLKYRRLKDIYGHLNPIHWSFTELVLLSPAAFLVLYHDLLLAIQQSG